MIINIIPINTLNCVHFSTHTAPRESDIHVLGLSQGLFTFRYRLVSIQIAVLNTQIAQPGLGFGLNTI